ncbi:anthranilate synthase component I [Lachnoclostridium phytofermentans]|uniref:Anthranilate synthase component 1 n=1 Tax=Lachnoclostridium phytofermentans (strain ATCC 700394 / DSM 18823 / ISDg) TaxID=357809 RepID=A9KL46_LACP7|nr:anthranilate synthase component I [Lachnoclostridium phytofermentans]ABX44195.1 anthranilate synthase component I [Lachnoclostridium phytofermentans ISDg]
MVLPRYEDLAELSFKFPYVPVYKEIYSDQTTPILVMQKLSLHAKNYYLFESAEGNERWGRYSFLGFTPVLKLFGKGGKVFLKKGLEEEAIEQTGDSMQAIRSLLKEYRAPKLEKLPSFSGGLVGYFGYEMIGRMEPKLHLRESDFEEFSLQLYLEVIAFDHVKQKMYLIDHYPTKEGRKGYDEAVLRIEALETLLVETIPPAFQFKEEAPVFKSNITKKEYLAIIEKTKHYIREGDIFQGVISRRLEATYKNSLMNAYRVLRTANPSPYMYFIHSGDIEIAGSSPETLVKVIDREVTIFPIAGTRPRGSTGEEDEKLEKELLEDEKELAEHNMLVDLARNDVGRVAAYQSVVVEEYLKVHRYSKVMHITSKVSGKLREDKDGCDALIASFPAGTLTGAPKIRACEIIEELEESPRGIYGGAIGYFDLSGNLDFCIAIRTAVKKKDSVYVQVGAGIVADSNSELEYEETNHKAAAVVDALLRAGEVDRV